MSVEIKKSLKVVSTIGRSSEQANFFMSNPEQQLRGYYASRGLSELDFDSWDSTSETNVSSSLLIKPSLKDSNRQFFKENLSQQFRSYYIALSHVTASYYDTDVNVEGSFNISEDSPDLSKLISIWENSLAQTYGVSVDNIETTVTEY